MLRLDKIFYNVLIFHALRCGEMDLAGALCGHTHGRGLLGKQLLQKQWVAGLADVDGVSLIAVDN